MGCGGSKSADAMGGKVDKDSADYRLDEVELLRVGVSSLDSWMDSFESPVNDLIGCNNSVNDILTDVKDASALLVGGYKTLISPVTGLCNWIIVELTGGSPDALLSSPDAVAAADDLAAATLALQQALVSFTGQLQSDGGALVDDGSLPEVQAFNAAVENFKAVAGDPYGVSVKVVSDGSGASMPSFMLFIDKGVYDESDLDNPIMKPASVLDLAKSKVLTPLLTSVYYQASALVATGAKVESASITVTSRTSRGSCASTPSDDSTKVEYKGYKTAFKAAVASANAATFKLTKACIEVYRPVNLATAVAEMVKATKAKVEREGGDPMAVTVDPQVDMDESGNISFSLNMNLGNDDWVVPDFLPAPARAVYDLLMNIPTVVADNVTAVSGLSDSVNSLIEDSKNVLGNAKDDLMSAGLGPMEAMSAMASITKDMGIISGCATLPASFLQTCKRVYDELQEVVNVLKA